LASMDCFLAPLAVIRPRGDPPVAIRGLVLEAVPAEADDVLELPHHPVRGGDVGACWACVMWKRPTRWGSAGTAPVRSESKSLGTFTFLDTRAFFPFALAGQTVSALDLAVERVDVIESAELTDRLLLDAGKTDFLSRETGAE
jgi:hypothetical protein